MLTCSAFPLVKMIPSGHSARVTRKGAAEDPSVGRTEEERLLLGRLRELLGDVFNPGPVVDGESACKRRQARGTDRVSRAALSFSSPPVSM
jgi:hypothetical protein